MDRDGNKAKKSTVVKKAPVEKTAERHQLASDDGKNKRGWSDVFDNLTYSNGPGDNIYVFG